MRRIWLVMGLVVSVASVAGAQTKISGVAVCAPVNPTYMIRVGDVPGHAYGLAQGTCKWTTPWEIAGVKNVAGVGTQIEEINGDSRKVWGTFVDTMANDDRAHYRVEMTVVTRADGAYVMNHKWELVGGTGKLRGIKGSGTCKGTPAGSDGSTRYDCEGQYTLPKS